MLCDVAKIIKFKEEKITWFSVLTPFLALNFLYVKLVVDERVRVHDLVVAADEVVAAADEVDVAVELAP